MILLFAWLSGCAGGAGRHDGRYVGEITPRPAVQGAQCGEPAQGVLDLDGDRFVFAPNEGVLVIPGRLAPDGALHGVLPLHGAPAGDAGPSGGARRTPKRRQPAAQTESPVELTFDGRVDGGRVTGVMAEPRCTAAVSLERR